MTKYERIELLEAAQAQLSEAIRNIEDAVQGTTYQSHARAYIVGHLEGWLDAPDRFNMGIQQYIDVFEVEYDVEDEE